MTKKKKKGKALGFLPSMKKPITPTTTPGAATTSGDGQPRPTERSTTSNDTGQLGPPGIPPDLNNHKEDSPVVTTDDTINTADLSYLNNDQHTQSETVATVTNQPSKSEDDHDQQIVDVCYCSTVDLSVVYYRSTKLVRCASPRYFI